MWRFELFIFDKLRKLFNKLYKITDHNYLHVYFKHYGEVHRDEYKLTNEDGKDFIRMNRDPFVFRRKIEDKTND